jgi:putative zinc finger/helix-turn-helix YgiT family protein
MNFDQFPSLVQQEPDGKVQCPNCGHQNVKTTFTADTFTYGDGPSAVKLTANVPLRSCLECGFQFLDAAAEDVQHEAVCRHLGVLTPPQIRALRRKNGLSRASFAQLTKLGEATIARWERGELIQNAAYDHLLYLLTFDENVQRIRDRNEARNHAPTSPGDSTPRPRLRVFQPTQADVEAGRSFELRRTRRGA